MGTSAVIVAPCRHCGACKPVDTTDAEHPRCSECGSYVATTERGRLARLFEIEERSADYMLGVNQGRAVDPKFPPLYAKQEALL